MFSSSCCFLTCIQGSQEAGKVVWYSHLLKKIFFNVFIYFNWRLITLQYCSGSAIHWHESAMGVHVSPILNPPPTSFPLPSLEVIPSALALSTVYPGLVICFTYGNKHVSMLFSQIMPPSPSPAESKSLFFTSVSLLLSCIYGHCYHLSKFHIYALIYYIGVFLSDLLHSV